MYGLHDVLRMNPIEKAAVKYQKRFLKKKIQLLKIMILEQSNVKKCTFYNYRRNFENAGSF